jgi:magnesium transporter
MGRFLKKQKQEIGISPDELLFRGEQKIEDVLLRVIDFNGELYAEETLSCVADIQKFHRNDSVTWFNVDGLHSTTIMKEIAKELDLDKLILSDVMDTQGRPKVHEYDNGIFLSIKMLQHDVESDQFNVENLSLIFTESLILSFQERKGDVFEPVRERIRKHKRRIRNAGTDYLAFALLDVVIDNYIYILSVLGEKIEILEETLLLNPQKSVIDDINYYKRELNFVRKNIIPAKEMILSLPKIDSDLIEEKNDVHFKTLGHNISQANDASDSYREILSDQLNIYHTTISSKLNDIMKFLTIFSVIFIPLTFIAGIYGTNFDTLPELHLTYGYYYMLGAMLVMAMGMLVYFRKKDWL